ncbi:MAG: GNAT family N-acetyltransferase [Paracoccus sp. (in: a-proteobacteria)]|uniref:GNAT family N-acetyltransferase n=1 Tax=Paracoccus sp. TaxID=267 RepID=UPI0026E0AF1D|nr:GNAT family N-acetyltransferase [Paracoccus sp. (in: a-proteobacteria)]MDO5632190.1 GNAT family N-acetyltransferase [Paracoccus sp. (in: a-proteobacteria)]
MSDDPPFTLRAFEPEDVPGLTEMLNMPGVIHGTLQRPFQSVATRRKINDGFSALVQIMAESDGKLVGHGSLMGNPNPRRAHAASLGMSVRDDFRRRGVGDALLTALRAQARDWLGIRRLELEVFADNAPAIALYEKHGFQTEGRMRAHALRGGELIDTLVMARLF